MADSPENIVLNSLDVKVLLDGNESKGGHLKSVSIEHHIGKIPRAKVTFIDGSPVDSKFPLSEGADYQPGKSLEIKAGYGGSEETIFEGIILKHRIKFRAGGGSELIIHGGDKVAKFSVGRKSKYFENSSDSSIISEILGSCEGTVDDTSEEHPLTIQSNISDWDFMMLRAEMNGLIAVVNGGKVDFVKPKVSESAGLEVTFGDSMIDFDMELDAKEQVDSVTCNAWDYKALALVEGSSSEPTVNSQGSITGKKLSEVLSASDYVLNTTAPLSSSSLSAWANAALLKSRLARIRGTVSFIGNATPKPNSTISIKGINPLLNGTAFVSGVIHRIERGSWTTTATVGLSANWFSESASGISLPAVGTTGGVFGLCNAKVKQITEDPDGQTRILVDIPSVKKDGVGVWARLATFFASASAGAFFIPDVGDEVILGFLDGNPNFPIILGAMYNGDSQAMPHDITEDNYIRGIVTKEGLKITFDDEKKVITVETPGKNKITLDDDGKKIEIADQNSNKIIMNSDGIKLESGADIVLSAGSGKISLESADKISLDAKQDISLSTKMNIKCEAKMNFSAEGKIKSEVKGVNVDINGSAMTMIKGGIVKIN